MLESLDVLGLGCAAVDDLLFVEDYPPADAKRPVLRRERRCGGLTATALVAAARLGCRCAYAGTLGEDEASQFVADRLAEEGVRLDWLRRRPDARPIQSVIVVDEARGTRTIFFDESAAAPVLPDWPPDEVIRASKVLLVDHLGIAGMVRAAAMAAEAGVHVLADFEDKGQPGLHELVAAADHLVVSWEFAARWTGAKRPGDAVAELWNPRRKAVVVTCGREGCWYVGEEGPHAPRHLPAYAVRAVDTTGCGDVFHGAYAAGLAEGLDLPGRLRLASATAALKAAQPGGQAGIPRRAAVEAFIEAGPWPG